MKLKPQRRGQFYDQFWDQLECEPHDQLRYSLYNQLGEIYDPLNNPLSDQLKAQLRSLNDS